MMLGSHIKVHEQGFLVARHGNFENEVGKLGGWLLSQHEGLGDFCVVFVSHCLLL